MTPDIVALLRTLNRTLTEAGNPDLARMVQAAIAASEPDRIAFLKSNELWGGPGSIADQAGVDSSRHLARKVESALICLGEEQIRLDIVNPRTASWVGAFSVWQRQGV